MEEVVVDSGMAKMYSSPYDDLPEEVSSVLGRLEIEIPGHEKPFSIDVRRHLRIDEENIEAQLRKCVEEAAFFGHQFAIVRAEADLAKRKVSYMRAKVRQKAAENAKAEGIRVTDKLLDAIEETDEEIQALEVQAIIAWRNSSRMYALQAQMNSKVDVLRTLAGFRKQEMRRYLDS